MNKIVFVSFENEKQAYEGAQAIRDLRTVTLSAGAIIAQDPNGKIVVRQSLVDRPSATLGGLLMDSLVGLLGPTAVAIHRGSGALLGAAIDAAKAGITTEFFQAIQNELASGKTGIIAELDEEWVTPIDIRMEELGGTVFRQTRMQVEDEFFEKELEAQQAELANLENEAEANAKTQEEQKSAERDARLKARIDVTKRKIQEKEAQLVDRLKSVSQEGEEKMASLQKQMAAANDEAKVELDCLLKDIRAEYQWRAKKLSQALERCKRGHAA